MLIKSWDDVNSGRRIDEEKPIVKLTDRDRVNYGEMVDSELWFDGIRTA